MGKHSLTKAYLLYLAHSACKPRAEGHGVEFWYGLGSGLSCGGVCGAVGAGASRTRAAARHRRRPDPHRAAQQVPDAGLSDRGRLYLAAVGGQGSHDAQLREILAPSSVRSWPARSSSSARTSVWANGGPTWKSSPIRLCVVMSVPARSAGTRRSPSAVTVAAHPHIDGGREWRALPAAHHAHESTIHFSTSAPAPVVHGAHGARAGRLRQTRCRRPL